MDEEEAKEAAEEAEKAAGSVEFPHRLGHRFLTWKALVVGIVLLALGINGLVHPVFYV